MKRSLIIIFLFLAMGLSAFLSWNLEHKQTRSFTPTPLATDELVGAVNSKDTFNATGTWIAPPGVTSIQVSVWGAGGGGRNNSAGGSSGGGGGGGAYSGLNTFAVVPGTSYTVTVGTGGTAGVAGGDSWFNSTGTVLAKGGSSGAGSGTGAAGGASGSGVGDIKLSGGNGGNGALPAGSIGSGGGGGAAGDTNVGGIGGNGASGVPGAAGIGGTVGGGNGGIGSVPGAGASGNSPGGGGGGAGGGAAGPGANGRVVLTYIITQFDPVIDEY